MDTTLSTHQFCMRFSVVVMSALISFVVCDSDSPEGADVPDVGDTSATADQSVGSDADVQPIDVGTEADTTVGARCEEFPPGECPEGFLWDEGWDDVREGEEVAMCKPIVVDLNSSEDPNDYLGHVLYGPLVVWDDWYDYQPLVEQVELLVGDETDPEVIAQNIASWIHTAKVYSEACLISDEGCISPANHNEDFQAIWESDEGICYDSAVMGTAMLRRAGVPAAQFFPMFGHATTLFYADGVWRAFDATFCGSENPDDCGEVTIPSVDEARDRFLIYVDNEPWFAGEDGCYCQFDFCMDRSFGANLFHRTSADMGLGTLLFPTFNMIYVTDSTQAQCLLTVRDLVCDSYGCFLTEPPEPGMHRWEFTTRPLFHLSDGRPIGFARIDLPVTMRYDGADPARDVHYRFACVEPISGRLIAEHDFTLDSDNPTIVDADDLVRSETGTVEEFDAVVAGIRAVTDDLGIDPEQWVE